MMYDACWKFNFAEINDGGRQKVQERIRYDDCW